MKTDVIIDRQALLNFEPHPPPIENTAKPRPSTIAASQAKGLIIDYHEEVVAGFQGLAIRACSYPLVDPTSIELARELLERARSIASTEEAP